MKTDFKMKSILIGALLVTMPLTLSASVHKSTETCNSGRSNVKCQVIKTNTNYRKNGSGDWLKSSALYQFRSTDGSSCKINGSLKSANNAKLVYRSTTASRSGDWGGSGIKVEQKNEGRWNYQLGWEISCRK